MYFVRQHFIDFENVTADSRGIICALLTKLVRSRWLDIGLIRCFFLRFYGPIFSIWLYLQVKATKTKHETVLLGQKFSTAVCMHGVSLYFQCIFGLKFNHGKLGILNYLKDLLLQRLKGSKQLLSTQKAQEDFRDGDGTKLGPLKWTGPFRSPNWIPFWTHYWTPSGISVIFGRTSRENNFSQQNISCVKATI